MARKDLAQAKDAKKDEFYTQLDDIAKELKYYKPYFKDKVVFCNCDDPYESNFFKYFALNFNTLGLKKLIATCYDGSPVAGDELPLLFEVTNVVDNASERCEGTHSSSSAVSTSNASERCVSSERLETFATPKKIAYKVEISEVKDYNNDGAVNLADVQWLIQNNKNVLSLLKGNGDFRSQECIELMKEADIVVTNPPFSLFREYLDLLDKYGKQFIIIGNTNALKYKTTFRMFQEDKIRTGYTNFNTGMFFYVPDTFEKFHHIENGKKIARVSTSCWYTNLPVERHKEFLDLYKHYTPEEYPEYDNFAAININTYTDIPCDYYGVMGVPITFLDKYNPEQFEIIWTTDRGGDGYLDEYKKPWDRYDAPVLHGQGLYTRILIRKKQ